MFEVVDSIAECQDPEHKLRETPWRGEVIHRFGVPGIHDARGIAAFDRLQMGLGGKMAYTIVIQPHGVIEQALPFDRIGWHAKGHSRDRLGIACIGDFRRDLMPEEQYAALVKLLTWLSLEKGYMKFNGHTLMENATNYPHHECPGSKLDMERLYRDVERLVWEKRACVDGPRFVRTSVTTSAPTS